MASTMAVTGWFSAKARTGPGMVAVGTKAELTNGRRISGYENALAPSTDFAVSPGITASQVSARVNSARMPATASHASTPAPERNPKSRAATMTTTTDIAMAASEVITCAHSTERPGDRHRVEPLEDPALQVPEEPVRRVRDPRRHRDDQDAGQQVVDVRARPRLDRAAEHEHEQQQEGDRHDRRGDDGVQAAGDVAQRPPGQQGGVTGEVGAHRGSSGRACSVMSHEGEEDVLEGRLLLDVLDLGRRQQRLELGQGAVLDDPPVVQDGDPVGELLGLVEVLRGQQHRRAVRGQVAHRLPHLQARLGVQPRGRLVEEDHRRVADQAHRDVEPAAHATGVGGHPAVGGLGQLEPGEQRVGDAPGIRQVPQPRHEHQVLAPGEDLVDRRELPGQADRLAAPRRPARRRRSRRRRHCPRRPATAWPGCARPWSCPHRWSRAARRCCPARRRSRRRAARAAP